MNDEKRNESGRVWARSWTTPRARVIWWFLILFTILLFGFLGSLYLEQSNVSNTLIVAFALGLMTTVVLLFLALILPPILRPLGPRLGHLFNRQTARRALFASVLIGTLIGLFYAEENWRGKHSWERYRREQVTRGEIFNLSELAPPPIPDDQNLAMSPLLRPLLDIERTPEGLHWRDTNTYARLTSLPSWLGPTQKRLMGDFEKGRLSDLEAILPVFRDNTNYPTATAQATAPEGILIALGRHDEILNEFQRATAERSRSRFPLEYDYESPASILLPHLAPIKGLAQTFRLRATARLQAGRVDAAMADLQSGFRLADSIRDEPLLISQLVRLSVLDSTLQVIHEGLARRAWNASQLLEIDNQLAELDLLADHLSGLRGERAMAVGEIELGRRQGWKFDPDLWGLGSPPSPDLASQLRSGLPRIMPGGWFHQNKLIIARLHERQLMPVIDVQSRRIDPEKAEEASRATSDHLALHPSPFNLFARVFLPSLAGLSLRFGIAQTHVDQARIACAIERYRLTHGSLPAALDTLVPDYLASVPHDLIDGKSLRYERQSEGGYVLYSIGWNRIDEGGSLAVNEGTSETVNRRQGDWVWHMPPAPAGR